MTDQDRPNPASERLDATKTETPDVAEAEVVETTVSGESPETNQTDAETETPDAPAAETGAAESGPPIFEDPPTGAHAVEQEEGEHRSFSAIALQAVVFLLLGGALALWAGPRIAPHLPAWAAPVATFLTPGADQVAELRSETEALAQRIAAVEGAAREAAESAAEDAAAAVETRLSARIDEIAADVDSRVEGDKTALTALAARIDALEASRVESPPAGGASTSLNDEIAALLRKDISRIDDMATAEALEAVEARVAALESGEAATAGARSEAERIRRSANLDAALTRIHEALSSGLPYARPLNTAVSLSGVAAPDALSALAESGAPTVAELARTFPQAARKAYAASVEAEAGDGFTERLIAGISGRIGGRPATETPGDDAGAVLSRIEARLNEGNLAAAADQAAALPPAAAAAMGAWLTNLEKSAAAERAYGEWRSALSTN
ncbi:hypothetical protein [Pikeienuella sp. HZG-20]|uniref:COG4223 family protein n=1 Tax=Paludibacillus litoralis TaxID=3133267 RepID=UPI0030EED882